MDLLLSSVNNLSFYFDFIRNLMISFVAGMEMRKDARKDIAE